MNWSCELFVTGIYTRPIIADNRVCKGPSAISWTISSYSTLF